MRIKCINNSNKLPNITINKVYTVYEGEVTISVGEKQYYMFKIEDDYGSVIPYEAKYFEIISNKNTNYIEKNISENTYKFTHKFISYDKFWSMLYDEAGSSIEDFWNAKKDIYMSEMGKQEMYEIIKRDKEDERDFILKMLLETNDDCFIENVIKLCQKQFSEWTLNKNMETEFLYLSHFKSDCINEFFIEYLAEIEKGNEKLDRIVYEYFNK
ncbi:hypothetical protein KYB31_11785 [Clostridium felsineum]|uniref:hypothetical protein n=1 Tax=Clostridium felsineum TaxID=36839 RepID=UPI00214D5DA5|nr:hypothetical protein [Clostridium felsineum]MCR3759660.1 hypothetical protein [Clostridium felsineum]